MAGSMARSVKTSFEGSDARTLLVNFNKLIDDVDRLRSVVTHLMPGVLLSAPALKTGTSSAKAWRSEAFTFTARGKEVSASAQEKALTATTHDTAASKESWYVLSVQADGTTFTITKGADQTIGTKVLPVAPDNEVIVGYAQVVTGAGGAFDATTDDFAVGGNIASLVFVDAPSVGGALLTAAKIADQSGVEITT